MSDHCRRPRAPRIASPCCALALALAAAAPAAAYLDVEDKGPVLTAGRFAMRVTNAGILGNAFLDPGLSYDPSFEFPRGSGIELLHHAELWVGGIAGDGRPRVSGAPTLEWRPTLDPEDRVRVVWRDRLGTQPRVDDDGDGRVDEEWLDGHDDDGDGEIDEDLGFSAQQMAAARYVDDRPEAQFVGSGGESHVPLGLSVEQTAYAWAYPGFEGIAGLTFRITHHGERPVRDLYVGLLADLDVRLRPDRSGHLDDRLLTLSYARAVGLGSHVITGASQPRPYSCFARFAQTLPAVADGNPGNGMPCIAVVPLDHTTDPLAFITPVAGYARAPGQVSFRSTVFSRSASLGAGGVPYLDADRYEAMAGRATSAAPVGTGDWVVLVSCGPFPRLEPGQSLDFTVALVAAMTPDSLARAMGDAAVLYQGTFVNAQPDSFLARLPTDWNDGVSGRNGHEACVAAPPGVSFTWDPHCPSVMMGGDIDPPPETQVLYQPGGCLWTDADCDKCTGVGGRETAVRWVDPGQVPPGPRMRVTALDHAVRVEWDNRPEVLVRAGRIGGPLSRFLGYRLYRVADWRGRTSLLPPPEAWALYGAYADSTTNSETLLSAITDTTLDYERILYEQRLYPVGRHAVVDSTAKNGFPHLYAVTSVYERVTRPPGGNLVRERLESPLVVSFDDAVVPRAEARGRAGSVWVVPNPFRARADWDLPPVDGDRLTRHLDFMGLPRARCTIQVWTVAGDQVWSTRHDGTGGDGQARWDLVSRNGQEVASGIYLFTVDSELGRQTGRFVVIR